jgi:hypothetical protein
VAIELVCFVTARRRFPIAKAAKAFDVLLPVRQTLLVPFCPALQKSPAA